MADGLNIISHNCVGSRIYQKKDLEYGNPFMWSIIPPDDFWYLYNHYDELNYDNIKLTKIKNDNVIIIDDKVKVYYVHYRYDKNAHEPTRRIKDGVDIYYDKINDYILEKYQTRLERMKKQGIKPIFIVTDREFVANKNLNMYRKHLINYVNKDDCIVVTVDRTIKGNNVIYVAKKTLDPTTIADIILNKKKL